MRNSRPMARQTANIKIYPFKSVANYKQDLRLAGLTQGVLDPCSSRIKQSRSTDNTEKTQIRVPSSRYSFKTYMKQTPELLQNADNKLSQRNWTNNFIGSDEKDEVDKDEIFGLLNERQPTNLGQNSSAREWHSKDLRGTSASNHLRSSKSNFSSPSLQEKDPFIMKSVTDRWDSTARGTFRVQSLKTSKEGSSRTSNAFGRSRDPSPASKIKEQNTRPQITKFFVKRIRSTSVTEEAVIPSAQKVQSKSKRHFRSTTSLNEKDLDTKTNGSLSPKLQNILQSTPEEFDNINPEDDVLEFLRNAEGSEVIDLGDMPLTKRTNPLKEVPKDVSSSLASGRLHEAFKTLDVSPEENEALRLARIKKKLTQSSLKNKSLKSYEKKDLNVKREHDFLAQKRSDSHDRIKRKEFYNKWFIPTEYWDITKEPNYKNHRYEELKKNLLFYYNNIHNYNLKDFNPLTDKRPKEPLQIKYEALQEKLKQSSMVQQVKRNLMEGNVRVPKFLASIRSDEASAL